MERAFHPWPEELARKYERRGYWQPLALGEQFRHWASRHATRTALVDGATRLSFADLDARIDRLAAGFHALGLVAGDRVLVQLPNSAGFVAACFALFRLGVVPVLAMPAQRSAEIDALCQVAEPAAYLLPERFLGFDYRPMAEEIAARHPSLRFLIVDGAPGPHLTLEGLERPRRDFAAPGHRDVALLLLSGGTTGTPKLIPRTHADYAYAARASAELCGLGPDSVTLAALPLAHNFPLCCPGLIGTFSVGGTVVLARTPGFDEAFPLIARERVTITALVPALARLWTAARAWNQDDLSSLALLQVGGARLEPAAATELRAALGCRVQQVFGMAEGLLCYTRPDDPDDVVLTTQGRPLSPDDEVRIVDEDGNEVAPGESGELLTRGPYTIRGYYRAGTANAASFTPDGFYRSGDLVRRTAGGNLVVEGRVKDQINRGGEKIAAAEIEQHLRAHPAVRDAAVVAVPDPRLGERSCAVLIAPESQPGLDGLHAFLRGRGLPRHKLPDQVAFVRSWPLTAIGKIDKKQLARLARMPEAEAARPYLEHETTIAGEPLELAARIAASDPDEALMVYERGGEWSVGIGRAAEIVADAEGLMLRLGDGVRRWHGPDLCAQLVQALAALPFTGWRVYGTAHFELARRLLDLPVAKDAPPLLHLVVPDSEIRLSRGRALLRGLDQPGLDALARRLAALDRPAAGPARPLPASRIEVPQVETAEAEPYRRLVAVAVAEIRQGLYQKVILSRRVRLTAMPDLIASYLTGRRANTPARSFLLRRDGFQAAGFSPETVVEVAGDGAVSTQPLAGTRALGQDPAEEERLRAELLSDAKEVAEHAVSVKLAHQELEEVCALDSIHVRDFMTVCRRGSVQHLGSRVAGRLRQGRSAWDAFAALFPAVTASGIPKRPAIEAIGRHEPGPRGLYSGCVLIADSDGALDAALVLRTVYRQGDEAWLQAGAGLVALSTPEREFRETCEKLGSVSPHLVAATAEGGQERIGRALEGAGA
ncbi:salicylate synthase [Phaeospirillum tilakii]|uniref:Salicylate synthase n=1 Tax=Phaeospirillum tilakii TaxID=741673 RepID=A0ABW5CED4_9PROT